MVFICIIGGCGMTNRELTRIVWLGIIVLNIVIWWSVFEFGFFITLFYLISCKLHHRDLFKIFRWNEIQNKKG